MNRSASRRAPEGTAPRADAAAVIASGGDSAWEPLRVSLFGRLRIEVDGEAMDTCIGRRPQELFCYLLLNRQRPHTREVVASALWGDHCTTKQSKTYLRKALWQLQTSLEGVGATIRLIEADAEWIGLTARPALHLDVATLEDTYSRLRDVPAYRLAPADGRALEEAISAYAGDLLEGWYQEWCQIERERLQQLYLLMLDKLMAYLEHAGQFEAGLDYGERGLRCDRARERTYYRLIRLHCGLGDRTGALRLYERCVAAVREELGSEPSAKISSLAESIRSGADPSEDEPDRPLPATADQAASFTERLEGLARMQRELVSIQERVLREIDEIGQLHPHE